MTPLLVDRRRHRFGRPSIPGTAFIRGFCPQHRRRAGPRRRRAFVAGRHLSCVAGLYRQRRPPTRRPSTHQEALVGRASWLLVSDSDANCCWTPTLPTSSSPAGHFAQHHRAQCVQFQQRSGTGGGRFQDCQYRQYRRRCGRQNSASKAPRNMPAFTARADGFTTA